MQTPAAARAALKSVILSALEDMKALEVKVLDVRGLTDIADYMVIASGTSDRHVRSVAQRVVEKTKEAGYRPHGFEGSRTAMGADRSARDDRARHAAAGARVLRAREAVGHDARSASLAPGGTRRR